MVSRAPLQQARAFGGRNLRDPVTFCRCISRRDASAAQRAKGMGRLVHRRLFPSGSENRSGKCGAHSLAADSDWLPPATARTRLRCKA
jgi:hypothetical protein